MVSKMPETKPDLGIISFFKNIRNLKYGNSMDIYSDKQFLDYFLPNRSSSTMVIRFTTHSWPPYVIEEPILQDNIEIGYKMSGPLYQLLKEVAIKANAGYEIIFYIFFELIIIIYISG